MALSFEEQIRDLEGRFKQQVEDDKVREGNEKMVYLQNLWPKNKADFVFIGSEPSLKWAGKGPWPEVKKNANDMIKMGFKNFAWSVEDYILHYSIRNYLGLQSSQYYLTDLSKGAMYTISAKNKKKSKQEKKEGREKQQERYNQWFPLLEDELKLFCKGTAVFVSIGREADKFLNKKSDFQETWRRGPEYIFHHGQNNTPNFHKFAHDIENKPKYDKWCSSGELNGMKHRICELTMTYVKNECKMAEPLCTDICSKIKKHEINNGDKYRLFNYKTRFEELKGKYL